MPSKGRVNALSDSLRSLLKTALQFRDEREWKQFHTFKDLAVTLSLEAAEVLEHSQWKTEKAAPGLPEEKPQRSRRRIGGCAARAAAAGRARGDRSGQSVRREDEAEPREISGGESAGSAKKYTEL